MKSHLPTNQQRVFRVLLLLLMVSLFTTGCGQKSEFEKGFDYTSSVSLSHSFFETREYDGNTLPSGNYDALRIILGDGEGKNWWCVMFPPLCISAADGDELPAENYALMQSGNKTGYKLKLKIVEWFRGIKKLFS